MKNVYEITQIIALLIATLFTAFWAKNYGIGKLKAIAIIAISQFVSFMLVFFLTWVENGFKNFGAQNIVRGFPFLILVFWIESKLFDMDFLKLCDFQIVHTPLAYCLARYGCIVENCCSGFYYYKPDSIEYKIAHTLTGSYQMPVQAFEAITSLIIFVIIVVYCVKTRFKATGYAFVLFHILYGGTRFLWEFLRDNNKIIKFARMDGALTVEREAAYWGISNLAIWSLAIFVVGVVMFICLRRYHKRQAAAE